MTDYLTGIEVLAIHADQIERYGGTQEGQERQGLRDAGLLEAALFRPQTGYYADLIGQAAALWESLTRNHAFVDGNKRIGFAATYTFLAINGRRITADADTAFAFISNNLDAGTFTFDRLEAWLRAHTCEM
jgi:death-on-curing protein